MVKMKKAALGAIGMASLKALDIGAGEEAISMKVEVSKYHKNKEEVQCNEFWTNSYSVSNDTIHM